MSPPALACECLRHRRPRRGRGVVNRPPSHLTMSLLRTRAHGLVAGSSPGRAHRSPRRSLRRLAPRPENALIAAAYRSDPFVHELLQTFALVGFGRIDVALRVRGDAVDAVELTGLASAIAERGHLLERLAHDDAHLLVLPVRHENETLLGILREGDVPDRARSERVLGEEGLLDEAAVRPEHLQPIVGAVADIDEVVVRAFDAVHGIAELRRWRRLGVVRAEIRVVRTIAIRAPVTFHLAGIGVEHSDALVEVAVGHIGLVGLRIDPDLGDAPEVLRVVASGVFAGAADLQQELAVLGELQDMSVLLTVAADPDIALVVDVDAMVRLRPLVALPRAAPGSDEVAFDVEDEDGRRRTAALRDGRAQLGAAFVVVERR